MLNHGQQIADFLDGNNTSGSQWVISWWEEDIQILWKTEAM